MKPYSVRVNFLNQISITKKLLLFGILGTAIPLFLLTGFALWQVGTAESIARSLSREDALEGLDNIVEGVYANVNAQQELLEGMVSANLNVAIHELGAVGGITFANNMISWNAYNQYTLVEQKVNLPAMFIGEKLIEANSDPDTPSLLVDRVVGMVSGTCTLFQRMNDAGDMLRVATNVIDIDGKRAINSYIPAINPDGKPNQVIASILAGKRYVGRAFVVNAWYSTAYEPIKDTEGRVVGMLYVGVPESSAESLRESILKTKVGETGYIFILDSKGTYIISKNGDRDGESIWDATDADGNLFIQDMIGKALVLQPGKIAEQQYHWQNPGEPNPRFKTSHFMYFAPWDWIIGAGVSEEEINESGLAIREANRQSSYVLATVFGLSLAAAIGFWLLIAQSLTRPIAEITAMLKDISEGEGDLTRRLEVTSQDEVGKLANYFNVFTSKIQALIQGIATNAISVASSATELTAIAEETSAGAKESLAKTNSVAASAEETSANNASVAAGMEQASTNLHAVASAVEEMTSTVAEIARNSEKAHATSDQAALRVEQFSAVMNDLGQAAQEIGKVTETITSISAQTNLLALNATIEAARAGAAGKGFAVVASEIKALAQQTAAATSEIKERIAAIQGSASNAVADIDQIVLVMRQVNEIVVSIAAAIQEQATVTQDIAGNIAQASSGVSDANSRVAQTASVSNDMAKEIGEVNTTTGMMASASEQVQISAVQLSQLAEQLNEMVNRFKV